MRLIDADALIEKAYIMQEPNGFIHSVVTERQIVKAPTIEAEPVKHGRWDAQGYCTNCGGRCIGYECAEWRTKYCPHCGAKMKGTVSLD